MFNTNKVICIDDDFSSEDKKLDAIIKHFKELPNKGKIYTIRAVITSPFGKGLLLEEIKNPPMTEPPFTGIEPNFNINRFRPLKDNEVEIEKINNVNVN